MKGLQRAESSGFGSLRRRKKSGLTQIPDKAIEAIRSNLIVSDEAFQAIAAEERTRRHDVMSAVFALEKDAPDAAGLI